MRVLNRIPTKWVEIHQAVNQMDGKIHKALQDFYYGCGVYAAFCGWTRTIAL